MIWSASRAASFRGAIRYVLHDRGKTTSNRVGMVHLENIAFDPREMEVTVDAARGLQARTRSLDGKRPGASGGEISKPVYHLSLSWHPDEEPSTEEMRNAARAALRAVGLQDHQALIVEHTDRPHKHIHLVVNLVHPDSGRAANLHNDRYTLDRWAHEYESSRNQIRALRRAPKMELLKKIEIPEADPEAEQLRHDRKEAARKLSRHHGAARLHRQLNMELAWEDYRNKKKSIEEFYSGRLRSLRTPKAPGPTFDMRPPRRPGKPQWMQIAEAMRPFQFVDRMLARKGFAFWKQNQDWSPDRTPNVLSARFKIARDSKRMLPPDRGTTGDGRPMTLHETAAFLKNARQAELASLARAHKRTVDALDKTDAAAKDQDQKDRQQLKAEHVKIWQEFKASQIEKVQNDNQPVADREPVKEDFADKSAPLARKAPRYRVQMTQTDAENQLGQFVRDNGVALKGPPIMDGKWHSVALEGQKDGKSGSYRGFIDGNTQGYVRNHKTDQQHHWKPDVEPIPLTPKQHALFAEETAAKSQARAEELQKQYDDAASLARIRWMAAETASRDHPYLVKKSIERHNIREDSKGDLLVPRYNREGELRSYQRITRTGGKFYQSEAEAKGTFHVLGNPHRDGPIMIAEGFATAASINEATGRAVYVAFDSGNLLETAKAVRELHPEREVIIAADHDHYRFTHEGFELAGRPDKDAILGTDPQWEEWRAVGYLENLGVNKAREAAQEIGATVVIPDFTGVEASKPTDFNDLAKLRGESAVRAYFPDDRDKAPEPELELSGPGYDR